MKVIIIGCDRLGAELAKRLSDHGHDIAVIDKNQSSFVKLHKDFRGRVHEGDALNQEVLLRAGIEEANVLLALTESDSTNYVLGLAAREIFHVPQVIVRNFDPACQVVCEHMGLQAISSAIWGAEQLEEMLSRTGLEPVLTLGGGEVEIYSLNISRSWEGRKLNELLAAGADQVAISLTRSGKSFIPDVDILLKENDILYIAANHIGIEEIHSKLDTQKAGGE